MAIDLFLPLATYPDPTPAAAMPGMVGFAAAIEAAITALVLEVDVPPVGNFFADLVIDVPGLVAEAEAESRRQGEALYQQLAAAAAKRGVALSRQNERRWLNEIPDVAAELARTHDLTMLAIDGLSSEHRLLAESMLFGSGCPLILFPAAESPVHLDHVVVAWDGSRAAARAVHDALPLLQLASSVSLLTVDDDKPIPAAGIEALSAYLGRHGVISGRMAILKNREPIGDRLQGAALVGGAGLLVMGAFGHSRMREFVLGGATQRVLEGPRLPILLAH